MRILLVVGIIALAAEAAAQEKPPLPSFELPVSLGRIRADLSRAPQFSLLDALDSTPHFTMTIEEERPPFFGVFSPGDFDGGPVPPGGLYAYEQQQRIGAPSTPPLLAFSLLPALGEVVTAIRQARRARAEAAARAEVERAMQEFCAAQPNQGAGVVGCSR
jgi:hypothetical protein